MEHGRCRWLRSADDHSHISYHRPRRVRQAQHGAAGRVAGPRRERDVLHAAFTPEGHLSYDIAARPAFVFRFQDSGEAEEDILTATERAESATRAWLDERGYGYKNLRSQAEDLSQAPLAKRQRRVALKEA